MYADDRGRARRIVAVAVSVFSAVTATALATHPSPKQADPGTTTMPIGWSDAFEQIVQSPQKDLLDKGDVLLGLKHVDDQTIFGQTMGVIDASPEACAKVIADFAHYKDFMPHTTQSAVARAFHLSTGESAVDFWSNVRVFGFNTRTLERVVTVADSAQHRYRSFWTLVHDPQNDSCTAGNGDPCENDLDESIGAHLFEPWNGDPNRTLHTYTLKLVGSSWIQRKALKWNGGEAMKDVTVALRARIAKQK
jgi:hypothetical protein